jgi:hypothetical protein
MSKPACGHGPSVTASASIDAHLAIVFAVLDVVRFIWDRTGWSIKRFVGREGAVTVPSRSVSASTAHSHRRRHPATRPSNPPALIK